MGGRAFSCKVNFWSFVWDLKRNKIVAMVVSLAFNFACYEPFRISIQYS